MIGERVKLLRFMKCYTRNEIYSITLAHVGFDFAKPKVVNSLDNVRVLGNVKKWDA